MVSLLFISNNPKVEQLRAYFQQVLKLRIDVVEDFDHGLKVVFEKRPDVVCIQDQIAGVTGESVARHIQLLLSNAAPHFILFYDGSSKVHTVPGIFNILIDLSGPPETVCHALDNALHVVLGGRWAVLSNKQETVSAPAAPDLLADSLQATETTPATVAAKLSVQLMQQTAVSGAFGATDCEGSAVRNTPEHHVARPAVPTQVATSEQQVSTELSDGRTTAEPPLDLLLGNFEAEYRQKKRRMRGVVGVLLILVGVAGLLFFNQRVEAPSSQTSGVAQQQSGTQTVPAPLQTAVSSVATRAVPLGGAQTTQQVLSFIPLQGEDQAFLKTEPGWSRYLTDQREYRLFREKGSLQALQVLARGADVITPQELQQAIHELCGEDRYQVTRQEQKDGLYRDYAVVSERADLLIYRLSPRGPVKAFVLVPRHEVLH